MGMNGLGAPVLEAYSGGYDPERYQKPFRNEEEFDDWSEDLDDGCTDEGEE